jgi:branched-chain amino acid transport system ATP-binding protein
MVILKTENLSKSFGGVKAVSRANLAVEKGVIHAIIGPNGAGKTTLFNMITGYYRCDEGRVIFKEKDISGLSPSDIYKRRISRTFQIISFFPNFSVFENVHVATLNKHRGRFDFFNSAKKIAQKETLETLELVGLREQQDFPSKALAYGDRRKLEIGIALASTPELLLLDEPVAGLTPKEGEEIMGLVVDIARKKDVTIVFVEHDMDIVFSTSEKITVMHEGQIIAEGKPGEIKENEKVRRIYLGEE